MLSQHYKDIGRYEKCFNAIFVTWKITFERLDLINPKATDLLSILSCYEKQAIPRSLAMEGLKDEEEFTRATGELQALSLIMHDPGSDLYGMRPLVEKATQHWLKERGKFMIHANLGLRSLEESFLAPDYGQPKSLISSGDLIPHTSTVLQCKFTAKEDMRKGGILLYRVATIRWFQGHFQMAKVGFTNTWIILRSLNSKVDLIRSIQALHGLATVLYILGEKPDQWDSVETMQRHIIAGYEKALGKSNPYTLRSRRKLAEYIMRDSQERNEEAQRLLREVLTEQEMRNGPRDQETLLTLRCLGFVLYEAGRWGSWKVRRI